MRKLSEYQQARQDLILDAIREQQSYERTQRGKIVKAAKDVGKTFIALITLTLVAMMFFSCEKEELEVPCVWTELTISGDPVSEWVCLPKVQ